MMDRSSLRRIFWWTGVVSASGAWIAWRMGAPDWAGQYAAAALFGGVNWFLLTALLLAFVERRPLSFFLTAAGKIVNYAWYVFFYLPVLGIEISSFLLGLNTFFLVIFLRLLGGGLAGRKQQPGPQARPSYPACPPALSEGGSAQ